VERAMMRAMVVSPVLGFRLACLHL
jgi:hypothetical protein